MIKNQHKSEIELIKEIEGGKYANDYLIYNRKSTDEPESQQNSLSYQLDRNKDYAQREGLSVTNLTINGFCRNGTISEKHSAFKESDLMTINSNLTVQFTVERPKFYRLVQHLNKRHFKGVVFLSWDRASRNPADNMIIKKLTKAGVDVRFALATYDKTSAGSLHQDIDGMFSEHHSRVTSEKVRMVTIKNKREGLCTNRAPVGYLNIGTMHSKPLDPERAPIIKRMYELADQGYSLSDIAKWATQHGFTMSPNRRRRTREEILMDEDDDMGSTTEKVCLPPKYTTIQKILRNKAYTGMVRDENGLWIKCISYEPIVSSELFERVQIKLTKKNKSKHYNQPLDNPFRNIFTCDECSRSYTPYYKKGHLYLGCRCKDGCSNTNRSINIDFISKKVGNLIQGLNFTKEELEEIDTRASTDIALFEIKRHNEIEDSERKKKKLREDLAYLRTNKLNLLRTATYTPEQMVTEETKLEREIETLIVEEHTSEVAMQETMKDVVKLSELLRTLTGYWEFAKPQEKEAVMKVIFSELSIHENNLSYQVTSGFRPFETRLFSHCAGGGT